MAKRSTPIPGLSFSWKRAVGLTRLRQNIARKTGIPTTRSGIERKIGGGIISLLFGKNNAQKTLFWDRNNVFVRPGLCRFAKKH